MCTLTHLKTPEGYLIYFNRDEQKTRPKSLPPTTKEQNNLKITMPIDPQSGGTWLATNNKGLTLCLLNAYTPLRCPLRCQSTDLQRCQSTPQSRGHIIPKLIQNHTVETLLKEIEFTDFTPYEEFSLVLFTLSTPPHLIDYRNGKLIHTENPEFPITSSGYKADKAIPFRKQLYKKLVGPTPTKEALKKFHHYQDPQNPIFSPYMTRQDAKTESITKLTQTQNGPTLTFHHQ